MHEYRFVFGFTIDSDRNLSVPERSEGTRYQKWPFVVKICAGGSAAFVVCLLMTELVCVNRAVWSDRNEIFGGGLGQCQERLSPEPARSVKV